MNMCIFIYVCISFYIHAIRRIYRILHIVNAYFECFVSEVAYKFHILYNYFKLYWAFIALYVIVDHKVAYYYS